MREVKKATSHGGLSIRSIFIFAITTIMVAFLSFSPLNNSVSAVANSTDTTTTQNNNQTVNSDGVDRATGESAVDANNVDSTDTPKTSCAIDGIGWIICPITKFLAGGMDWIYSVLSTFLNVQPMSNDQDTAIFRAWSYMRSFANIAFVIAFLVIIYSQMTNLAMSNYGIKKLLPRLIIAAILVNVSYYICAIAVDISNILGTAVQDLFVSIREKLLSSEVSGTTVPTWSSVVTLILGGGGALAGTFVSVSLLEVAGLATFIVPAVLGAILAVFVAFIIMAARQALITILIILSPLAFVAYLLPNTEKWFEKWKSTLMTMLLLFPIFSVIFGGSQLASVAIIQNAHSMAVVILGLLLQAAPLLITPMLMKFSGSILSKVGGMVNNPSKGLIDRSKNWGRDIRATNMNRSLLRNENSADRNWARSAYRKIDQRRFNRENDKKASANAVDSRRIRDYSNRTINSQRSFDREAMYQTLANESAYSKAVLEQSYEELKSGNINSRYSRNASLSDIADRSKTATRNIAISSMAAQTAKRLQSNYLAESLKNNPELRVAAGGIDTQNGAQRAMAAAIATAGKSRAEILANANTIIDYANPSSDDLTELACGRSVKGIELTADVQEAAVSRIAASANARAIIKIAKELDFSPTGNEDLRVAFASNLPKSPLRPAFLGYKLMDEMTQGIEGWSFVDSVKQEIFKTVNDEKLSTDMLVSQAIDSLGEISETMSTDISGFTPSGLNSLRELIMKAYSNPDLESKIGEKKKYLDSMLQTIEDTIGPIQQP